MSSTYAKLILSIAAITSFFSGGAAHALSSYDKMVLTDGPVLYLPLSSARKFLKEHDLSGKGNTGWYLPKGNSPMKTTLPNGDVASVFDGVAQYVQVDSKPELSVRPNRALTIEAWIRPDVLEFPRQEGDGYVHWAGKGEAGDHEYVFRMYSKTNSASRPNRISAYAFNPQGGLGSGSYFQDVVIARQWMHVAMVIDTRPSAPGTGTISIYKNGILRKTTPLDQFDVVPQAGNAPLRLATRDMRSLFKGAMGKFAVYAKALSATRLRAHFVRMTTGQ